MNTFAVVCLLLGCSVLTQAMYVKPKYQVKQVYVKPKYQVKQVYVKPKYQVKQGYCYDYMGRPVYPAHSYYDGCNTCTCGQYGRPTFCTRRYCGDKIIDSMKPVYPVSPVRPVYPVHPVKRIEPVYPVNPVKPVYPVHKVKSIKPVYLDDDY